MIATTAPTVLPEAEWLERRRAHHARVTRWTAPHRERAARGAKHPVHDFLFSYYSFRPAWLERWQPGPGLILTGDQARLAFPAPTYRETGDNDGTDDAGARGGVTLDLTAIPEKRRVFIRWLHGLLSAMRDRPAVFNCFGWHEWAMVYRQTPDEVRHNAHPLRFPPDELAAIVERANLCCTHHDAFRFFTTPARPLNRSQPTREDVPRNEQGGCLHANMDLYKWAAKLVPWCPAELVADCFELARDIRELDMRASPYDLRALGFDPVPIETPEGRATYERAQRTFAARAHPLRERLLALCETLLAPGSPDTPAPQPPM